MTVLDGVPSPATTGTGDDLAAPAAGETASGKQTERLQSLWDNGYFSDTEGEGGTASFTASRIARLHRNRALRPARSPQEEW